MIDSKTIGQARNADIITFFEKYNGFTFTHRGGEYRCRQHPSLAVKHDRLSWYWHSKGIGGYGVLDYLIKVDNMPFRKAVEVVTGATPTMAAQLHGPPKPKPLVLPEKTSIGLRLYDYLCNKRGIHSDIVNMLTLNGMLYEDRRGNVVFVGYDEHNKPRFATLRGTHGDFRGDCAGSDKRYGFNTAFAPSKRLYLFESAIDLMSHASLEIAELGDRAAWEYKSRLSLAGTTDTAIPFFLNQHKAVKELVFCLDNDQAGREATTILTKKYAEKGYAVLVQFPRGKDFNEDLIDLVQKNRLEKTRKTPIKMHNDMCI